MAKTKTLEEKLWGAAILKMSFSVRGNERAPAFKAVYPGVLRDLGLEDAQVDAYIEANRAELEKAVTAGTADGDDDNDD
jgi:4'-phosphopantetheinyl transferase EntD